jgi:hypothetical protein
MDRSFLSQPKVIVASADFVCIRLTTYENADEAKFLKRIAPTGSGQLENTVFTILSPDGKKQLVRGSRSARETFDDADHMAATMKRIAAWYPKQKGASSAVPDLPIVATVRLGIDVAACDNQPLVLLRSDSSSQRRALVDKVKQLAWTEEFRGRFVYAVASSAAETQGISGAESGSGLLVLQPDRFGQSASRLANAAADASASELANVLRKGLALHRPATETFADHVHDGHRQGVFWETVIPVSDPMEQRARERGRRLQGSDLSGP